MKVPYCERYDGLQLKIECKKLKSGKCQVRFQTHGLLQEEFYGYTLVEGEKTLKDVVREIKARLVRIGKLDHYYQQNLFSINLGISRKDDFVIFKA